MPRNAQIAACPQRARLAGCFFQKHQQHRQQRTTQHCFNQRHTASRITTVHQHLADHANGGIQRRCRQRKERSFGKSRWHDGVLWFNKQPSIIGHGSKNDSAFIPASSRKSRLLFHQTDHQQQPRPAYRLSIHSNFSQPLHRIRKLLYQPQQQSRLGIGTGTLLLPVFQRALVDSQVAGKDCS